jgi:hypothetical protein
MSRNAAAESKFERRTGAACPLGVSVVESSLCRPINDVYSHGCVDYLWKGAQLAGPFKAYVGHSQIETLVWYSAYPTVSTVNVITNSEVRRSLFKPLVSCEIDSLLQNL